MADYACESRHTNMREHVAAHLAEVSDDEVAGCARLIRCTVDRDAAVYTLGNGGSASSASHFACDLSHVQRGDGWQPRVYPLFDTATLTASANDIGYDTVFASRLQAVLRPADLVICLSVSGRSANVVRAARLTGARGGRVLGLLGCDGGTVLPLCESSVVVRCGHPGVVESVHLALLHEIAERAVLAVRVDARDPAR